MNPKNQKICLHNWPEWIFGRVANWAQRDGECSETMSRAPKSEIQPLLCFYCTHTRNGEGFRRYSCSWTQIESVGGAHELVEKNANVEAFAKQKEATIFGTIFGLELYFSQNNEMSLWVEWSPMQSAGAGGAFDYCWWTHSAYYSAALHIYVHVHTATLLTN